MQIKLNYVTVPMLDLSFYLLYALDSVGPQSRGHVRIFKQNGKPTSWHGFTLGKSTISFLWDEFQSLDKVRSSWIDFAFKNIAIGYVLNLLPEKALEIDPEDWIYTNHKSFSDDQIGYINSILYRLKLNSDIISELSSMLRDNR